LRLRYQQFKLPPILPNCCALSACAGGAAGFMSVYALIGLMVSSPGPVAARRGQVGPRLALANGHGSRQFALLAGLLDPVPGLRSPRTPLHHAICRS
jgi:hypothetical protein